MAESSIGRPTIHEISKLAQCDAKHRQETEIISADQLTGTEVNILTFRAHDHVYHPKMLIRHYIKKISNISVIIFFFFLFKNYFLLTMCVCIPNNVKIL